MVTCPDCGYEFGATVRGFHRGRLPLRIVDLLEVDAPLTAEQIAAALNANVDSVRQAVWRLWQRQLIVQRPVQNPTLNGQPGARVQWRLP